MSSENRDERADASPAGLERDKPSTLLRGTKDQRTTSEGPAAEGVQANHTTPNIRRDISQESICVLTFDRPGSSANVFDLATLLELDEHLDFIANNPQIRGVVLTTAKKSIFVAGADLHALASGLESHDSPPSADLDHLIEAGQSVFQRLASLPIPTIAAIHGACVGGGYELCLACDYRIASPDRVTKIGLPETQLGILPAWGGSTRLPRLIGLPRALDVILAGKTVPTRLALKLGMVDDLAPAEYLLRAAMAKALMGKPVRDRRIFLNNPLTAFLIAAYLRPKLLKKTHGHYPAVLTALSVVTKGVSRSIEQSLTLEREAIPHLARTEACRNLLRIFFLQERAKKLSVLQSETVQPPVERVAVIGAGVMGAGIAQWLSARGLAVLLRDVSTEQIALGMRRVSRLFGEGVKRHLFTIQEARVGLDRIFPAAQEVPLGNVDLVIEAAVEKMPLKKAIFHRLAASSGRDTILATNTSALSVAEIAASTNAPERVVGLHFFNPVHRMQLVEVIVTRQTDFNVVQRTVRFVQQIGKLPVVVNDSPGFLVNRILMPYLIEAGHLFEAGAEIEDIDGAMLDFGMPMGPLRLIDEVGVDVAEHVSETLVTKFSDRLHMPNVLGEMLKAGLLGRKTERGFYLHNTRTPTPHSGLKVFRRGDSAKGWLRDELQKRMVLLMVNEAARCLEEQVVSDPADVDFAMILGTGFAPFRGGPLRYADLIGAQKLVDEMNGLAAREAPHFGPCDLLQRLARDGHRFYEPKGARA